jgi:cohesin domain-containing protein
MDRVRNGGGASPPFRLLLGVLAWLAAALGPGPIVFGATLTLPGNAGAGQGGSTTVPILVDVAAGFLGTDVVIAYDPNVALVTGVTSTTISSIQTLTMNLSTPGVVRIALYGSAPLTGSGALLNLSFTSSGAAGRQTPIAFVSGEVNEGAITAMLIDGRYCVQGRAAPVANMTVSRAAGSTIATLGWDVHPGATAYNLYRGSSRDLSDLACFASGIGSTTTQDDGALPPLGGAYFYLVTARTCAGESSPGFNSSGVERTLPAPCQ